MTLAASYEVFIYGNFLLFTCKYFYFHYDLLYMTPKLFRCVHFNLISNCVERVNLLLISKLIVQQSEKVTYMLQMELQGKFDKLSHSGRMSFTNQQISQIKISKIQEILTSQLTGQSHDHIWNSSSIKLRIHLFPGTKNLVFKHLLCTY